mgnify:CR=1 FL=1
MTIRDVLTLFRRVPPKRLELATRLFCVLLLVGLTIKSAVLSHWGLVVALVVLSGILFLNTMAPLVNRRPPVPVITLMLALVVTVCLTTLYLGLSGAIWMFPALVGLRYAGGNVRTGPLRLVLVIVVPLLVAWHGDLPNAWRLFAAGLISALYLWLAEGQVLTLKARLDRDEGRDPVTGAYSRTRLEGDLALIPGLAPVGLLLLRLDGVSGLRDRAERGRADALLADVAKVVIPMLSARERLYRLGGQDFLIALAGWRSYESYELGQQLQRSLSATLPSQITLRLGVAEVSETEAFATALDKAYAQLATSQEAEPLVSGQSPSG